jgi:hypothetical protein
MRMPESGVARHHPQLGASDRVDRGDLVQCRGAAGADRPARLIGQGQPFGRGAVGQRLLDLRLDDPLGAPGVALGLGLAAAQDHLQPMPPRRRRLGPGVVAGLVLVGPALRMADDGQGRPGLDQHRRRDAAGMRALVGLMDVLRPDRQRPRHRRGRRDQREGHAQAVSTPGCAAAAAAIASTSPSWAFSPCIFQLPATSLRRIPNSSCLIAADTKPRALHKLEGEAPPP